MKLFDVVMNLAKEHTKAFDKALESETYFGIQYGTEKALMELAQLPELVNDPGMKSIIDRLNHGMSALPLSAIEAD